LIKGIIAAIIIFYKSLNHQMILEQFGFRWCTDPSVADLQTISSEFQKRWMISANRIHLSNEIVKETIYLSIFLGLRLICQKSHQIRW